MSTSSAGPPSSVRSRTITSDRGQELAGQRHPPPHGVVRNRVAGDERAERHSGLGVRGVDRALGGLALSPVRTARVRAACSRPRRRPARPRSGRSSPVAAGSACHHRVGRRPGGNRYWSGGPEGRRARRRYDVGRRQERGRRRDLPLAGRRGVSVAPFKAQNMSNNSIVTAGRRRDRPRAGDAGEGGRHRADVAMNPVLLKPGSDRTSHVVLMGRADGTVSARVYQSRTAALARRRRGVARRPAGTTRRGGL